MVAQPAMTIHLYDRVRSLLTWRSIDGVQFCAHYPSLKRSHRVASDSGVKALQKICGGLVALKRLWVFAPELVAEIYFFPITLGADGALMEPGLGECGWGKMPGAVHSCEGRLFSV